MSSLTRQLYGPTPSINKFTTPVPVDKGGTGGVTPTEAVENLGGIPLSKANVANGWPRLEADLTLDASLFPVESQGGITINGPLSLLITNTGLFKITNYDSEHVYTVTADHGFVAQSGDTIYYTAPTTAGEYGFVVDGKVIPVTVSSHFVTQPDIITPANTRARLLATPVPEVLYADDRDTGDQFGHSIALSADASRMAVGNHARDVSGVVDAGKVYIYTRSGSTWVEESTITASDRAASDYFGVSVALSADGSRLAVGANSKDVSGVTDAGKVYIYTRSGSTWTQEATLSASDKAASDYFGVTVAFDSTASRLAVGAHGRDVSGVVDAGQVYIYTRSGSTWTQESTVTASDKATGDQFGRSVALSADGARLAVGAISRGVSGIVNAGQVYIYTRSGSVWTQMSTLAAADKETSDNFGVSVAFTADASRLAVGAHIRDVSGIADAGKVYIYILVDNKWTLETELLSPSLQYKELYGSAIAFTSDTLCISARLTDSEDVLNCGGVYTYDLTYENTSVVRQRSIVDFTSSPFALSGQYLESTLTASDRAAGDRFGSGIALTADGSRLAVGALAKDVSGATDAGKVYIYVKLGNIWVEESQIVASDYAAYDSFGHQLCFDSVGNRLAVGAQNKTVGGITGAGQVYIYTRSGSVWTQEATISASDRAVDDYFGTSVALSADASRLAVGAHARDVSGVSGAGKVYIYSRSGNAWIEETTISASDRATSDYFGVSVALSADASRLAVGAYGRDVSGVTDAGQVYIYTRSGSTWTQEATITASDRAANDNFGHGVKLDDTGSLLFTGSSNKTVNGTIGAGKAYIFKRTGTTWTEEISFISNDVQAGSQFGRMISSNSNGYVLAVSANVYGTADMPGYGQVYTYLMSYHLGTDWQLATDPGFVNIIDSVTASVDDKLSWQVTDLVEGTDYYVRCRHLGSTYGYSDWSPITKLTTRDQYLPSIEIGVLTASDRVLSDLFGISVALAADGTRLAVGAHQKDVSGLTDAGKVYIYTRSGSTWTQESTITASDRVLSDLFGISVALSADGTRLAVGAHQKDVSGLTDAGKVYIYTRTGSVWTEESTITASDKAASDYFGHSVALTADGSRMAVGAYTKDVSGITDAGKVYIYTRSGSTWTQESTLTASDRATGDNFGISVAFSADASRLAVGARAHDVSGVVGAGQVYIYTRSGSIWTQESTLTAGDKATSDYYGRSVALSADGARLAVGATRKDVSGATDAGKVYIYTRSGSVWTEESTLTASDKATSDYFGVSVALSADGSRLAVGANGKDVSGLTDAGQVYFFK